MNKTLLITSTDLMMVQFLVPHIKHLAGKGYIIDIACSNVGNKFNEVKEIATPFVRNIFELRLKRNPLSPKNFIGYFDAKKLLSNNSYDYIWTNEPVMGVVTRFAARKSRKKGTKVLYMAHGFHFYTGAPLLNWCIYFPIEKLAAKITDIITCVNKEDYQRAQNLGTGQVYYIHGIGINTDRLTAKFENRNSIKKELGLGNDDFIVLSIGELNKNKNQSTIIKAIAKLKNPKIHYIICGKGAEAGNLKNLVKKLHITNNVHFLGYRRDVVDICTQANLYAMPSFREGLPVSSLEAMYCGLPLVTSNIRGLIDVNKDGINGYLCDPNDYIAFAEKISRLINNPELCQKMGDVNRKEVIPFTIKNTLAEVENLFEIH